MRNGLIKIELMRHILTVVILGLVSCDSKVGVEFIVHNRSTVTIDSVRITTSDKGSTIKLTDIKPGQEKREFLNMREILKSDGDYHVEINTPGVTKINNIGYYTNGSPQDENIDIHYFDDSVKCDYKLREY